MQRVEERISTADLVRSDARVEEERSALFAREYSDGMRAEWDRIQTGFVDQPRQAVQDADHLVATVIQKLAQTFSEERGRLEQQWDRGDQVNTEDLRLALQRYRSFFHRLLAL